MAGKRLEALPRHLARNLLRVFGAREDPPRHRVRGAPRNRIVKLRAHQHAPGVPQDGTAVAPAGGECQCRERLGDPLEPELGPGVGTFERRAGGVHALKRPGVAVGAELAAELGQCTDFGRDFGRGRAEVLIQPGDPDVGLGLESREQLAYAGHRGRRVVIRADRHRDV